MRSVFMRASRSVNGLRSAHTSKELASTRASIGACGPPRESSAFAVHNALQRGRRSEERQGLHGRVSKGGAAASAPDTSGVCCRGPVRYSIIVAPTTLTWPSLRNRFDKTACRISRLQHSENLFVSLAARKFLCLVWCFWPHTHHSERSGSRSVR